MARCVPLDWSFLDLSGVRDPLELVYRQGGSPAVKRYVVEDLGQVQFRDIVNGNFIAGLRKHGCPLKLSDNEYSVGCIRPTEMQEP